MRAAPALSLMGALVLGGCPPTAPALSLVGALVLGGCPPTAPERGGASQGRAAPEPREPERASRDEPERRSEAPSPAEGARRSPARAILDAIPSEPAAWVGAARPQGAPQRVVTLAPGLTEMVFALGAGSRVVATSAFADHPPEATTLPKVGGLVDLDVEALLTHRPALVVVIPGEAYRSKLQVIADTGVPVRVLPGSSIADALLGLRDLGRLLEHEAAAAALIAKIRAGLEAVAAAHPLGPDAPRVAFVFGWRPLYLAGGGTFPDELATLVGAVNAARAGGAWARWSYEGFLATGAEVIIDGTSGAPSPPPSIEGLPAVARGRVHPIPHDGLRRPGPRLVAAARALARVVHGATSTVGAR